MTELTLWPSGETINLEGSPLAAGAQGELWALSWNSREVAKVYFTDGQVEPGKLEALRRVRFSRPEVQDTIALPTGVLYRGNNQSAVGYTMPFFTGRPLFETLHASTRRVAFANWTYRHHVRLAMNVCRIFDLLHSIGMVVGDISSTNLLVRPDTTVAAIDTDSMQIRLGKKFFFAGATTEDYTPPELQDVNLWQVKRMRIHDYFGMAVLIHQILLDGEHPFAGCVTGLEGKTPPTIGQRIDQGLYPIERRTPIERFLTLFDRPRIRLRAPTNGIPFKSVSSGIRKLFQRAFAEGYDRPTKRPNPTEWLQALKDFQESLIPCSRNERHWYGKKYGRCFWCDRRRK